MRAIPLEGLPVRVDWFLQNIVREASAVAHRVLQIEEGRVSIDLIPSAHYGNV